MSRFDLFGSYTLVLASSLLGLCFIYYFVIYALLLHPLRRIPRAHWSVAFPGIGSLWILYVRYGGQNNVTIYKKHQKLDDVIRLGYNELSINCVDNGIRTVYGGGWEKNDWYARRSVTYGVINMFLTVHHGPHSQKKRTLANIYSKSYLQSSPQLRANTISLLSNRFWPMIQSFSESDEAVDVYDFNNAFNMDSIAAFLFGISHSTNFTQDVRERKQIVHNLNRRHDFVMFVAELPPALLRWLQRLRLTAIPSIIAEANNVLEIWTSRMCDAADQWLLKADNDSRWHTPGDEPVVYKQFKTGTDKLRRKDPTAGREILSHIASPDRFLHTPGGLESMARNELHSEMFDHLDAGSGTSAVTLTYLYWEMSRNPSMQERLHHELLQLTPQLIHPNPNAAQPRTHNINLPDPKTIDALPYLHATIMETLRLHAPILGSQPRTSPHIPGGSTLGTFSGIPGGTLVSAMGYTLHRHEPTFPNPEVFNPDRWLTSSEKLKEMNRWFWAFGSGGRMCIGSHFAMQSMKLQVGAVYTGWRTEIADGVDDGGRGMEMTDGYAGVPRAGRLMLRFIRR